MRFYEQVFDGRTVIAEWIVARDDVEGEKVVSEKDADCWIAAKKAFGYQLTAVQDWLLGEFYRKREEALRKAA